MSYLDRTYEDEYDELVTFQPKFYRDVYEMQAILRAHGDVLNEVEDNIDKAYNNAFVDRADEETITELERFYWIATDRTLPLDERKRIIKSYMIGSGKISGTRIKEMIKTFVNATETDVDFKQYDEHGNHALFLKMVTEEDITRLLPPLRVLLRNKIPAHLYYTFEQFVEWGFDNRELMDIGVPLITHGISFTPKDVVLHNGAYQHNGEIRRKMSGQYGFDVGLQTKTETEDRTEYLGHITIESVSVGAHLHDGEIMRDGTAYHKSVYTKEVIE